MAAVLVRRALLTTGRLVIAARRRMRRRCRRQERDGATAITDRMRGSTVRLAHAAARRAPRFVDIHTHYDAQRRGR